MRYPLSSWFLFLGMLVGCLVLTTPATHANTFNVTSYGARPDGKTDSTVAFQRAVNDAAARARLMPGQPGGAVVYVPSGPQPYVITSPIFVDGSGIEIRGNGPGTVIKSQNGSPIFVFGLPEGRRAFDQRSRPDALGVLDESAAPRRGARFGIATRGDSSLVIPAHPLCLGHSVQRPDYWVKTTKFTLEFFLSRPEGVEWKEYTYLFGMTGDAKLGRPWSVTSSVDGKDLLFNWRTSEGPTDAHIRRLHIPLDRGTRRWRVTIQLDLDQARFAVWVNGARAQVGFTDLTEFPFKPGLNFVEQDGYTPFLIGAGGTVAPTNTKATTELFLYGLRVSQGLIYHMNGAREVFNDDARRPVNDFHRYFWNLSGVKDVHLIGLLTMDDPPPSRVVKVSTEGPDAYGFWVGVGTITPSIHCGIRQMQLRGMLQPPILLASVLVFHADHVISIDALQGIGCLNAVAAYTINLTHCFLGGNDAAYYGYQQTISARDTYLLHGGRETVRLLGCNSSWDQTFVAFLGDHARAAFRFLSGEYGGIHRMVGTTIDNEGESFVSGGAVIEVDQPNLNSPGSLTIDSLYCCGAGREAVLVRCNSLPIQDNRKRCMLDVRGNFIADGPFKAALELNGPAWIGTFDGRLLEHAESIGIGANAIKPIH